MRPWKEPLLTAAVLAALGYTLVQAPGCTPFLRRQVAVIAADTAKCVVEHIDLPNDQVALICGVTAAERVIMDILLAEGRRQAARAAAEASSRAGCPSAPDGGAP